MTSVSQAQMPDRPAAGPLRSKSGWIVALGIVYVIAGVIALSSVVFATKVTVFVVGIMMLISGIAEVINAFQFKSWGKFLLWFLIGLLFIAAGLVTQGWLAESFGWPVMMDVTAGLCAVALAVVLLVYRPPTSTQQGGPAPSRSAGRFLVTATPCISPSTRAPSG